MTNDPQLLWHQLESREVAERLQTDVVRGLDSAEVQKRLEKYGANEVEAKSGPGPVIRFLLQFHQPLIYILIAAGVVTLVLQEYVDAAVIFAVVVLNATVGYIQEARALSALTALSKTLAHQATVVREGERHTVASRELVPGDVVIVQSGDKVPADLRLVRVRELQVEEAAFTGESVPVFKDPTPLDADTDLAGRTNMAYSSTLIRSGHATGVVVATGNETEVGRISQLIETAEDIATPLTRRIGWLSRILMVAILALAGVTFFVGLAHGEAPGGVFLASVAFAVAAIPEGLPAVITVTLAIGVGRMAGRRAIIRKLPAVETLGSTTVICSDKTGTLTQNQMTVQRIWAGGNYYSVSGVGYAPVGKIEPDDEAAGSDGALMRCLLSGLLCNEASLVEEEGRWGIQGDPTEGALIVVSEKAGLSADGCEEAFPRLDTIPFESQHQYMATLHRPNGQESNVIFVKGAAEAVVPRCNSHFQGDGGKDGLDRDYALEQVRLMAESGLRVLAFAEKEVPGSKEDMGHEDTSEGLTLLGIQGMIDPPREEAIVAVRDCKRAGITVKMITGDHAVTASAIAQQIGIGSPDLDPARERPRALSGRELEAMDDAQLYEVAQEVHVFARIPPDGKLRLVRALQERGHIVAMTGDGVNDGPALSQANIGIAMGITGTEVAREASDMVLTDDNFASIVAAVEEGRGVFDNLTKFLVYILPTNLGQGCVILLAILLGITLPMLPVQVLWVNMTTAIFLGLMLAFEPKEPGIMKRPPRDPRAQLLTRAMGTRMLIVTAFLLAGAFGLFEWSQRQGGSIEEARTVAVNLFIVVQIFYLVNCRSLTEPVASLGLLSNLWVLGGISIMAALQVAFTYAPPMNTLFHTEPIGLEMWLLIGAVGVSTFVAVEIEKRVRNVIGKPITQAYHKLPEETVEHA
jgi:cation-transporting P-type ATPase F